MSLGVLSKSAQSAGTEAGQTPIRADRRSAGGDALADETHRDEATGWIGALAGRGALAVAVAEARVPLCLAAQGRCVSNRAADGAPGETGAR